MSTSPTRVGIRDVAQLAGVSISSVSRVLDDRPGVSSAMRNRVMHAVDSLGYVPDHVARGMRTGATMTIGFVAGDTGNPLIAEISAAAQTRLSEAGYALLMVNSASSSEQEVRNIRLLTARRVDGLLLSIADESNQELQDTLASLAKNVVLVDRYLPLSRLSAVHTDHRTGIRLAARYLVDLGHRRIALISGNPRIRPTRERTDALRESLAEVPDAMAMTMTGEYTPEYGYDATMAMMRRSPMPTALIAGSNQILVGVLRALRDLGITYPRDISLVTCDATPLAELSSPPIAAITRDTREIGSLAAELVLELVQGGEPRIATTTTTFEVGSSCSAPRQP